MKDIQAYIHGIDSRLDSMEIAPDEIVFEERVKLACFNCMRYGVNHTCPPRIPQVDYRKAICEYEHALLVWCIMKYNPDTMEEVRRESTLLLHRALLQAEKYFWDRDNSLATSFIGGSCKLCAQGCAKDACRQPRLARIPVEATGINVIETCRKKGMKISFPTNGQMYRIGLLLW